MDLMPDIELVVVNALKASTEIDELVDGRIYTAIPAAATFPLVVCFRVGGLPTVYRRVDSARIQVDAWGEIADKAGASALARTVHAVLWESPGLYDDQAGAVVTNVEPALGVRWLPDPDTGRPRYSFDLLVSCHPAPVVPS